MQKIPHYNMGEAEPSGYIAVPNDDLQRAIDAEGDAAQDAADSLLDDDAALAALQVRQNRAPAQDMTAVQASRVMMMNLDPLLRKLPYEQRTAVLLNLLVTYAAEQPAATERRGKFINAMCEEFRNRLQQFLPLEV